METNLRLYVRNIIGDSVDGYSRVTVNIDAFDAMKQSIFARRNRQAPMLNFLRKTDEGGNNFTQFYFNGVEVRNYFIKDSKKTVFLMKTENAKALLDSEEKAPSSISKFNLSVIATA